MAEKISPETRSRMMAGIRGRDTQPNVWFEATFTETASGSGSGKRNLLANRTSSFLDGELLYLYMAASGTGTRVARSSVFQRAAPNSGR